MTTEQCEQEWAALLAACGKKPFLAGPAHIGDEPGDTLLSVNKVKALIGNLCAVILCGLCFLPGYFLLQERGISCHIGGGVFLFFGCLLEFIVLADLFSKVSCSRQLRIFNNLRRLSFVLDSNSQEVSLPMAGLEVRLERGQSRSIFRTPKFQLELVQLSETASPLLLASTARRDTLLPVFHLLGKAIGIADDESLVKVPLECGGFAYVNPDPNGGGGANFRTCKLVVRSPQLAEVMPTLGIKAFYGIFLAGGAAFGGMALTKWHYTDAWIGSGVGLLFAAIGYAGISGMFGPRRITFDLAKRVVTKLGGKMPLPELAAGLPLERLAVLQMCAYTQSSNNGSYMVYELNAVLHGEEGDRFTIMTDCDGGRLEEQAKQLKDLLNLPLIDNT